MTDNEIIKDLKYVLKKAEKSNSVVCEILTHILSKTLDLINRQKEELENYSHNVRKMTDSIYKYQKEIEQLKEDNEILRSCVKQSFLIRVDGKSPLSNLKAEAYKEFAERLKALFPSCNEPYQYWEIHEETDNLVKEMVGDK